MTNLVLRWSWIFDMRTDLLHYSTCFTSLFLYVLILLTRQIKCQTVKPTGQECSRESVTIVEQIAVELSKVVWFLSLQDNNCMLYTPTETVYENCSRSMLMCFALELEVLFAEIQSVAKFSQKLLRIFRSLQNKLQDNMKSCPDCEVYHKKRAETFLKTLQNALQWMNAGKKCTPRKAKRHLENFMKKNTKNVI